MSISPDGGFPVRIPLDLGGAGHFLASQLPDFTSDGDWIAYISTKSGSQEIWLWSTEDSREIQLTHLGARINSFQCSPDGAWIAFAGDRYGNYDIYKVTIPDGRTERLTSGERYEVYPSWTPDSRKILYVELDEAWKDHSIFEIDGSGENRRAVGRDKDFFDYQAGGTFGYPAVSPDGKGLLFRSQRSGWINYWLVPMTGGEPKPLHSEAADQSHARWAPDGSTIAFISNYNGTHKLRLASPDGKSARTLVDPGTGVVGNPEWAPDGRSISYTLQTPTKPADLFVLHVGTGAVRQLTHSMPEGNLAGRLIPPEKVSYSSTGGFKIHAYLYKPPTTRSAARHPALVWIHGGPTSQFNDTMQHHVQYFAQRGYVVILPNIRGSSGYGREFEEANNGCWGQCDMEDVLAGVDYLKTLPFVDEEKLAITGTSYGGCMSMSAVAFAPGVFQAAIPASGYGDWIHFMGEQELRHIKLLEHEFGPLDTNREIYVKNSPYYALQKATTPVFLIHGEGHFPESQASKLFADELQRHYKVFQYKAYPNENYYVRSRLNRLQMLRDMLEFLDRYLGR
jgi:dipeptidyl aminopeptidase/acylaminoacyl peptidase